MLCGEKYRVNNHSKMEVMEVVTAGRNVKEGESERERVDRLVVIGRQPLLERAGAFNRLCW